VGEGGERDSMHLDKLYVGKMNVDLTSYLHTTCLRACCLSLPPLPPHIYAFMCVYIYIYIFIYIYIYIGVCAWGEGEREIACMKTSYM
jgi:hypothetical protein